MRLIYADETKRVCRNIGGLKVDFSVKRIGSQPILDTNSCADGLKKEINGCNNGGRTAYSNWEYT